MNQNPTIFPSEAWLRQSERNGNTFKILVGLLIVFIDPICSFVSLISIVQMERNSIFYYSDSFSGPIERNQARDKHKKRTTIHIEMNLCCFFLFLFFSYSSSSFIPSPVIFLDFLIWSLGQPLHNRAIVNNKR